MTNAKCTCKAEHWQPHAQSCPAYKLTPPQCIHIPDGSVVVSGELFDMACAAIAERDKLRADISQAYDLRDKAEGRYCTALGEIEVLRGNLSLAEEGLASYALEVQGAHHDIDRLMAACNAEANEVERQRALLDRVDDLASHNTTGCGTCSTVVSTINRSHEPGVVTRLPVPGTQMTRLSDIADELIRQLRKQGMEKMQAVFDGMRLRIDPWPEPQGASRDVSSGEVVYRKWPGEPPHCMSCDCGMTEEQKRTVPLDDYLRIHRELIDLKYPGTPWDPNRCLVCGGNHANLPCPKMTVTCASQRT